MKVSLLHYTPKEIAVKAIRKCWKSDGDNFGEKDQSLIKRIISYNHLSTLEHINYTFEINDITRCMLQELARTRIGISLSVESTRYTLKKILNNESISDTMISTTNWKLNYLINKHMTELKELIKQENLTNDIAKYGICENYPVTCIMTMNVRSLRHFLELRMSSRAHFEIREFANMLLQEVLKETDHYIFFEDLLKD